MALMMCEQLTSYDLREFRRSEACNTEDSDGQWSSFYNFEEIEDVVKWHSQDFEVLKEMMIMTVEVLSPEEEGAETKTALEIEFEEKIDSLMDGPTVDRNNLAQKFLDFCR